MKIVAILPARLDSSRFPGKLLAELDGLPILAHAARNVRACPRLAEVVVATGDEPIALAMERLGIPVVRTARELPSGTDRIAEANDTLGADVVVNIQGDEPLVGAGHVEALLGALDRDPDAAAATLRHPMPPGLERSPHVVKVVCDRRGRALYFSRHPLEQAPGVWFKHLGMYAFRRATLDLVRRLPPAPQERAERLEQLRLLDAGLAMAVADAPFDTAAVDVPEDLETVRRLYQQRHGLP